MYSEKEVREIIAASSYFPDIIETITLFKKEKDIMEENYLLGGAFLAIDLLLTS